MNQSPTSGSGLTIDVLLTWCVVVGLSVLGGFVSFWQKLKSGHARAFNFTELVGEIFTSGLVGFITANLCDSIGAPSSLKYALVGIMAHMGSRALFKLEAVANSKFNLPPDAPAPAAGDDHAA